ILPSAFVLFRSVLIWLFLALLLSLRGRPISASRLRMLPSHLGATRSHLWIARHLIPHMRLARRTSGSSRSAGVHFRLVPADVSAVFLFPLFPDAVSPVALFFSLQLVCVCAGFSCPSVTCSRALPIMFSQISAVVFSFSRSRCCSLALTLG